MVVPAVPLVHPDEHAKQPSVVAAARRSSAAARVTRVLTALAAMLLLCVMGYGYLQPNVKRTLEPTAPLALVPH